MQTKDLSEAWPCRYSNICRARYQSFIIKIYNTIIIFNFREHLGKFTKAGFTSLMIEPRRLLLRSVKRYEYRNIVEYRDRICQNPLQATVYVLKINFLAKLQYVKTVSPTCLL